MYEGFKQLQLENRTFSHNSSNFFSHFTELFLIITELFLTFHRTFSHIKKPESLATTVFQRGDNILDIILIEY